MNLRQISHQPAVSSISVVVSNHCIQFVWLPAVLVLRRIDPYQEMNRQFYLRFVLDAEYHQTDYKSTRSHQSLSLQSMLDFSDRIAHPNTTGVLTQFPIFPIAIDPCLDSNTKFYCLFRKIPLNHCLSSTMSSPKFHARECATSVDKKKC